MSIQAYIAPSLFDPFTWNNFKPKNNFWQVTEDLSKSDIVVYIDKSKKIKTNKFQILYLIESEFLLQIKYLDLINYLKPDLTVTFNKNLINNKNIVYAPAPFKTWIKDQKIYKKTKICSFISSMKQTTPMQKLRVSLYKKYKDKVDCYGIHTNPIENKLEGLKDYCFSFAAENDIVPGYFTEKILDCFVTGTVPIYIGHKYIKEIFDERGIIFYDDAFDINTLTHDRYISMLPYIETNFNIAQNIKFTFDDYFLKGINLYEQFYRNNSDKN